MLKQFFPILLIICIQSACQTTTESKEIVFVCTHGAARSPIAAAYFNKLAKENNLNYHASFRGTDPDKVLTKETLDGLTKDGFDIGEWKPEKISDHDVERAFKIITFDCSVPSQKVSNRIVEWNGTPSISTDYTFARNQIKNHVEKLIRQLAND